MYIVDSPWVSNVLFANATVDIISGSPGQPLQSMSAKALFPDVDTAGDLTVVD